MRLRASLVLCGLASIWGASFLFIKVAVGEISPATLVVGRLVLSVLALGLVAVARPAFLAGWRRYWWTGVLVGLTNNGLPYLAIAWGETRIASGMASILNATTPLFTVLLANWWIGPAHESLTARRLGGVLVGFVGVAVLVGPQAILSAGGGTGVALGDLTVLAAGLSYAFGGLLSRRFAGAAVLVPPLTSQVAALVLTLPIAVFWSPPTRLPSLAVMGSVAALGVLGTSLAYLLYFWLIQRVGATRTVIVTYLLPCTALIWGALLLGETVSWNALVGLVLVLAGTIVTNGTLDRLFGRRPPRPTDKDLAPEVLAPDTESSATSMARTPRRNRGV
ncbi:MAG TPA: DMT family transporter [Ktedonobacterales bacterium]|jgi:drug/metabolite transporter (DMT)-like permease